MGTRRGFETISTHRNKVLSIKVLAFGSVTTFLTPTLVYIPACIYIHIHLCTDNNVR